nr:D-alanyl-D-alanine carboxypeptidase family protein [uncultured Blautia sp.]
MKFRCSVFIYVILICNLCCQLPVHAVALDHAILMVPQLSDDLYALSAVMMDADSGRILYEKEGETPRPNASTTKVLTCILALENSDGDDYVQVSANAASQPQVKLGLQKGEQYYLEDLLYSLLLQSHNDSAVAIAEHIGSSVEGFSDMMNAKAREIGCMDTHFITPNGLDAEDSDGIHHTTASDLARIMRYAIKNKVFLKIAQTKEYSFSDLSKKRTFSVHNTNALFSMTDGVLAGKTGFTGDAGYCYVCAVQKDDRTFIIALLAAGWPGHKTYKWHDTLKLLDYGKNNFYYHSFWQEPDLSYIPVKGGIPESDSHTDDLLPDGIIYIGGQVKATEEEKQQKILLNKDDRLQYQVRLKDELQAPVRKGEQIGRVIYMLNGQKIASFPILAVQNVDRITFLYCAELIFRNFFH